MQAKKAIRSVPPPSVSRLLVQKAIQLQNHTNYHCMISYVHTYNANLCKNLASIAMSSPLKQGMYALRSAKEQNPN